jgi:hypothetical protein
MTKITQNLPYRKWVKVTQKWYGRKWVNFSCYGLILISYANRGVAAEQTGLE